MAIATAYRSVDMDTGQTSYGNVSIANASHIQIEEYDYSYVQNYYGSFTYSSDYVSGGTLRSTDYYEFGSKAYEITGLSHSAVAVANYINSDNIQGLFAYIFAGADTFNGSSQNDVANGFDGSDQLYGNGGDDLLKGGLGTDFLRGGAGSDSTIGGDGSDTYYVEDVGDVVSETNADATTGGYDFVHSFLSSYTLTENIEYGRIASAGTANLTGNSLNNSLYAGAGDNILDGGTGSDTADYSFAATGVNVDLSITTAQATGGSGSDTLISIENLTGSNYNDRLLGNSGSNVLSGGAGNDILYGGAGVDYMMGGAGSDNYYVEHILDFVGETDANAATGGSDFVHSYLSSYTLAANVEDGRIALTSAANLTGNNLNNVLYAEAGDNILDGGAGSDTAAYGYATAGVNVDLSITTAQATEGSGADTLTGIENLYGSNYDDRLTGDSGANVLWAGADNDTLRGSAGSDYMIGGDGSDTYYVEDAGDFVSETNASAGTGGSDFVHSYLSSYTLAANVEDGRIALSSAANLTGNSLNNVLYAGAGSNILNGSTGNDTAAYGYAAAGVNVDLSITTAQATGGSGADTLTAIENLYGSNYDDRLTGNSGANVLWAGAGADTLRGGAGNDYMIGGDGSDTYYVENAGDVVSETNADSGTGGYDSVHSSLSAYTLGANVEYGRIVSAGTVNLTGNSLNNVLHAGSGNNVLDGSTGSDTAAYGYATAGVSVDLSITTAQSTGGSGSDTLIGIENLYGSNYDDRLTGNGGANVLSGGSGNDVLYGGAGADYMVGGNGNDNYEVDDAGDFVSETDSNAITGGHDSVHSYLSFYALTENVEHGRIASNGTADLTGNSLNNVLYAGAGDNILDGSTGNDTAAYSYATAGVNVELSITGAQATGGSGLDTLTGIENLTGSNYNDRLIGNSEANILSGGTGNDILYGGAGADYFIGGNGKDYIYCGTENDGDVLEYGNTAESQGTGRDVLFNFSSANVRIDLSRIDANTSVAGDQAFGYSASNGNISSMAKANGLWFGNEILYGDVDGNTTADFEIQLVGASSFALDALVL